MRMDQKEIYRLIRRRDLEDTLRAECLATISERVARYLEVDVTKITPNQHWASISAECLLLYRDGYFFACIALSQAVAEAIVRELYRKFRNDEKTPEFEKCISILCANNMISLNCKRALKTIWRRRNDFHHLNPGVPSDHKKLQDMAKKKMLALASVESEIFAYEVMGDGTIRPRYPEYWPQTQDGLLNVFLRFEP